MMKCFHIIALIVFMSTGSVLGQATDSSVTISRVLNKEDFSDDWAGLSKYKEENQALPAAKKGENRVVFLGSSIFERWSTSSPQYFKGRPYINRGISGQISPQLLIRFRQDVIDLKPKVVVILAGSNDIAGDNGHVTIQTIMDNIISMVELAGTNHINVVLCKYLPVADYPWRRGIHPAERIIALNKSIAALAIKDNLVLLDYFTPFVNAENGQKAELTIDGVHPNLAGYKIMERITDIAIKQALRQH